MKETEEKLIMTYKQYLFDSGLAEKTIVSYMSDIKIYQNYLESMGETLTTEMKRQHIVQFKKKLMNDNKSTATINKAINSLYSFSGYLKTINPDAQMVVNVTKDKIRVARGSESEVDVFSDDEIIRILDVVSTLRDRDRLIVYLLLYTGVRVSELVGIRLSDIDLMTRQLKIIGKGGKYREIPLKEEVVSSLRDYISGERSVHPSGAKENLLLSQRGPLKADAVNKILLKLGRRLDIVIFPHKFRHHLCSSLIRKGIDIVTVAKITGHANINTTAKFYVNVSRKEKKQAIDLL